MAGSVNYKAVILGDGSPKRAQGPGKLPLTVSSQVSGLAERPGGSGEMFEAEQQSPDPPNQDLGSNINVSH